MKLSQNLTGFNLRMAAELRNVFANDVIPYQTEDGDLVFRGPIDGHADQNHIGTHVSISLDRDVQVALEKADEATRAEMTENLLASIGGEVKAKYHPQRIGTYALQVQGTMRTIEG